MSRLIICLLLATSACSRPLEQADKRYDFVYGHGTNRDVCEEARRRKAIYVDAQQFKAEVWLAPDIYCHAAESRPSEPANSQSAEYRQFKQIESDTQNESDAAAADAARLVAANREAEDQTPVCDRPDSPGKRALMNEIGTNCLGE